MLTFVFNIASAIYCIINSYLNGETMNWLLTGACAVGFVALCFLQEKQGRRAIDEAANAKTPLLNNNIHHSGDAYNDSDAAASLPSIVA
jgi:hypothetical protein